MTRLFHCNISYACFGFEATNDVITLTAHINSWMMGKTLQEIKQWLKSKNAIVTEI